MSIPSTATKLLAADWGQIVQSGLIKKAEVMGFNSLGCWIMATDSQDRLRLYVLSDIVSTSGLPFGFDQTLTTYPNSITPPNNASNRKIAIALPVGLNLPVSLPAGTVVRIQDSAGGTLSTQDTNRMGVSEIPSQLDGVNNAVVQTATGVATATQLVSSGTRYNKLSVKNIGANPAFLGFDNTVAANSGYELTALTGTSDEKLYDGFNANLWVFSTLGTTISIEARG